jgi:hypothetical protein
MLRKKRKPGRTIIAMLVVVAALATPAVGAASVKDFGFQPDASWAEGA